MPKSHVCGAIHSIAILSGVLLLLSVLVVATTINNSMDTFDLRPAAIVLLGNINIYKYGSVNVSTEDLLSDNTQVWLANEESLFSNESISEPQVLSNSSGNNVIYTVSGSNFTYEFFSVTGSPGSVY